MQNQTKHIILSAAKDCFVQCGGCYNFFGKNNNIISSEEILTFLKKIDSTIIEKITVSGGDPLARTDIIYLLSSIQKLGFLINMDTVGTSLVRNACTIKSKENIQQTKIEEIAPYVNMLGIPLDGSDNNIIKLFRKGRSSIFEEQLDILETAKRTNLKICINTVVHKDNVSDLINIGRIITNYPNIVEWQLFQFMPIGPLGFLNKEKYNISDEIFNEACSNLTSYMKQIGSKIYVHPKSKNKRKKLYLLIDTDGFAWTPFISDENMWNPQKDENNKRIIIGNITNPFDIEKILKFITEGVSNENTCNRIAL